MNQIFQILTSKFDWPFKKDLHVSSYLVFFKKILKLKQRSDFFEEPGLLHNFGHRERFRNQVFRPLDRMSLL